MTRLRLLVPLLLVGCSATFPTPPDAEDGALAPAGGDGADDTAPTGDTAADTAGGDSAEPDDDPAWREPCGAYAEPEQTGTVTDGSLDELSGVAVSWRNPGLLWVLEDHAGANAVYGLDAAGETVAVVTLDGVVNNDWESLAVGPCDTGSCVFVGDIGDNDHDRPWHGVLRFPEPELLPDSTLELTIQPTVFAYVFPDGSWDSEAMVVLPDGRPVLLTKEYDTEASSAYRFPSLNSDGTATLELLARFATGEVDEGGAAAVTGADLWPDASRLLVRTYGHILELAVPDADLTRLGEATRTERATGSERQGEAISYDVAAAGFVTVSEGVNPPLYRVACAE